METIRVCVVEDMDDIREGLRELLTQTPGFACLATYAQAEAAVAELPALRPDIVIMDINLPGMTGVQAVRQLHGQLSGAQFMMFTVYENGEQVFEALAAGASSYLLKNTPPAKVIEALRELHAGGAPMTASIARQVVSKLHRATPDYTLTPRETEILDLLAKGLLYKEIADLVGLTTGTVRQHIHKMYEKLHVQNRTEAINKAYGKN